MKIVSAWSVLIAIYLFAKLCTHVLAAQAFTTLQTANKLIQMFELSIAVADLLLHFPKFGPNVIKLNLKYSV